MNRRTVLVAGTVALGIVLFLSGCGVSHREPPPPEEPDLPSRRSESTEVPEDTAPQPPQEQPAEPEEPPEDDLPSPAEPPSRDTPPKPGDTKPPPADTSPEPKQIATPTPDTTPPETTRPLPFQPGERLTYVLTYTGISLARMKFHVRNGPVRAGSSTFKITGSLKTRGVAKWIVTIDDRIQSIINQDPLFSWSFIHRENHNGDRDVESSLFDQNRMIMLDHNDDTTPLENPVHDPISAFYTLRTLPLGDLTSHSHKVFLDGELYTVNINRQNKERLYTVVGRVWTHKIHVTTNQDDLKEKMKEGQSGFWIWITEQRRIPVQLRIPAAVGSIWVELDQYRPGDGS